MKYVLKFTGTTISTGAEITHNETVELQKEDLHFVVSKFLLAISQAGLTFRIDDTWCLIPGLDIKGLTCQAEKSLLLSSEEVSKVLG